jgi:Family of unknown function (DUF6252)
LRIRMPLAAFILAVAACGGSKSTTSPSPPTGGGGTSGGNGSTLSALIDGATWNQPNVVARYSATNNKYLEVDSIDPQSNLFGFAFGKFGTNNGDLTPGTYEIGATNTNANFVTVGGTPTWSASPGVATLPGKGSGRVVLTSFSATAKTASGTFNFVLVNGTSTKTVTNGVFSVKW